MKTNILIFEHDILKYPPILSIIDYLIKVNDHVEVVGYCHDRDFIAKLDKKGVTFHSFIINENQAHKFKKILRLSVFRKKVQKLMSEYGRENIKLWLFGETCIWTLHKLVYKFDAILYLFETPHFKVSAAYRVLSPSINYRRVLQHGKKVVCCEYNRAHITQGYFGLSSLPSIIPNKPYQVNKPDIEIAPSLGGKKVILYQGIFNYPERQMDELCQAVELLSNEFIICLMGDDNDYKNLLKDRYQSDRIIFLPFASPPQHLAVTQQAYIGFLSYTPITGNARNTLNTLYCAPNKIFEYSMFSIPMVSNDVPALKHIFSSYQAGIATSNTKESLAKAILQIDKNYDSYQFGAKKLFESVDLDILFGDLLR